MARGFQKPVKRLNSEALWEYAVKTMARRAHSSGELRQKLRPRAERIEDVDATLARLKECGYLNDPQFAESYASARLQNQRFGKSRVLQDLRQRRVAPAVATKTIQKVYESVNETELIEEYIRRKFRLVSRENLFQDEKDLAAAYRRLQRAGFSSGNIMVALKKFARNPELLDDFTPPDEMEEE